MDSKTAKKIRSSGSQIELILAKAMWKQGLRYRKQCKDIFGKPDFCFRGKKIAIFCDSDFWHGKKYLNGQKFKTNSNFWKKKIERNIERDKEVNEKLSLDGWRVIRFEEQEILQNIDKCVETIKKTKEK